MSYCRWSSDFGECDVYVYADVKGGWTTHVASRRLKHRVPDHVRAIMHDESIPRGERFLVALAAEKAWRDQLPCDELSTREVGGGSSVLRVPKDSEYLDLESIGPEAGRSFNDPSPGACADRLEALRSSGFLVPQDAIDALRSEHAMVRHDY